MGERADISEIETARSLWAEQARAVDWFTRPRQVLGSDGATADRWFVDGTLNTCYNALDRHVIRGRGDEPALLHHSAVTGRRRSYSYAELLERVAQLAGGLWELGVRGGDRVLICLPPIPEAVFAMLACARIGAVHVVVAADSAPDALTTVVTDSSPALVIAASCRLAGDDTVPLMPIVSEALEAAGLDQVRCLVLQRPELTAELRADRDLDFGLLMRPGAFEPAVAVEVAATDASYVLPAVDSGAAVIRDQGGHAVVLSHWFHSQLGLGLGDVVLAAAPLESVVAHSALVYAPLLAGATTVLYEGDLADVEALGRAVEEHGVSALIIPGAAAASFTLAGAHSTAAYAVGEPLDAETSARITAGGLPVTQQWWLPELSVPLASTSASGPSPARDGRVSDRLPLAATPGCAIRVRGEDGSAVGPGAVGAVTLASPLPPGSSGDGGYGLLTTARGSLDEAGLLHLAAQVSRESP